jgi:hypothetical protein
VNAGIETLTGGLNTLTGMLAKDKKLAVSNPSQPLNPAHTDSMPSEYLSLEALEKWIVFGLRLSHTYLSHKDAKELWSQALNSGGTTSSTGTRSPTPTPTSRPTSSPSRATARR